MKKTFLSMLLIGSGCAVFAQVEQTTTDTVPTTTQPTTQPTMTGSTPDDKTTLTSTGAYSAYSAAVAVPTNIQTQFTTETPGASDVRWEQNNQWYRATYKVGAHRMRKMFDMRGNSWAIALPVTNGLIPDDVIERAYTLYGDNVYDITILKTAPKAMTMSSTTATGTTDMNNNASVSGNTNVNSNNASVNANANVSNNATTDNNMNAGTAMTTSTMNVGGNIYQVRIIENGILRTERMNEDGTPYTEAYWRNDSLDVNQQNLNQDMNQQQNWNNNTTDSLQQQTTDTSGTGVNDGTMNMNNSTDDNTNPTDDATTPSTPTDDSTDAPNQDATVPSSEPKLQK